MRHLIACGVGVVILLVAICLGNETEGNEIKEKEQVCRQKEKCAALIDLAEDFFSTTKGLCSKSDSSPDCVEKSSTHLDFTKKFLGEVKENFHTCKACELPRDCTEVLANGEKKSGVYTIFPSSDFAEVKALSVFCDMETDGGGWTVIQRRGNFTPQQNFHLLWNDYKVGFGDVRRDFWLGNDNIYALSNQGAVEIRVELGDVKGNRRYAVYENFRLEDEDSGYTLRISNYSGNASDCMTQHSGKKFSTKDEGNTAAVNEVKGAWWITETAWSHLNGLYLPGEDSYRSVHWYNWLQNVGLAFTEMKVRLK